MREQKDTEILKLIKKLNLTVSANVDRMFSEYGLTASQCEVLDYLIGRGGEDVISTDVHMELGTSRASVSMILKRLRQKGYVVFGSSPGDDRRKRIHLTERSCRIAQKIEDKAAVIDDALFRGFSRQEREQVKELLLRMLLNLQAAEAEKEIPQTDLPEQEKHEIKTTRNRRLDYDSSIT